MSTMKKLLVLMFALALVLALAVPALATGSEEAHAVPGPPEASDSVKNTKALAGAISIGIVAAAAAVAMGSVGRRAVEGVTTKPEAASKIRSTMMLSIVFIETAVIYALLIVIMIIFVL
ncbi:MAG: ATP synthase F0 subunit C [Clostridia bacterium]|nr:ATP synthase F0 subunit C [Clostridia bacterium]